jgi:RNA polymerase sigma factor (sigma-70 family)
MDTRSRLRKVLDGLQQEPLTDSQLLARFLASRDEAAFAALVRRHGPLVLGVCRRVLRHRQDAEDAFQATFLILARRAGAVLRREALGSFLYGVAYRTALQARALNARRRARETQVEQLPHPAAAAEEPQDWRPVLDRELERLPDKYRTVIVLCDLQALSRKEAARRLGVPEGTLSSRLATARRLLAQRLTRRGITLSGGALAAGLCEAASTRVPAVLAGTTAKAAVLVAAGHLAAVSPGAGLLMKGVLKTMFLAKVKMVAGVVFVAVALAAGGIAYRVENVQAAAPEEAKADRPVSELDALRKENELLRLNLQVVLEKVRAQEEELRALRRQVEGKKKVLPPVRDEEAGIDQRDPAKYLRLWRQHVATGEHLSFRCRLVLTDNVFQTTTKLKGLFRSGGPGRFRLILEEGNDKGAVVHILGTDEGVYQSVSEDVNTHKWGEMLPRLLPLLRLAAGPSPAGDHHALELIKIDGNYLFLDIKDHAKPNRAESWRGRLVVERKSGLPRQVWIHTDDWELTWDLLDGKADGKADPEEFAAPSNMRRWQKLRIP